MKRCTWRQGLQGAMYLTAILVLVVLSIQHWNEIADTISARKGTVIAAMVLSAIGLAAQAASFRWFLGSESKVSLAALFRIWAMAGLVSHVVPFFGGAVSRVAMLKAEGIDVSDCINATIAQAVTLTGVAAVLLVALAPVSRVPILRDNGIWVLTATSIFILVILSFSWFRGLSLGRMIGALPTLGLSVLSVASSIYLVFIGVGASLGLADSLVLAGTVFLIGLVNITPNNIGPLDAWLASAALVMGATSGGVLSMILILRLSYVFSCGLVVLLIIFHSAFRQQPIVSGPK